MRRRASRGAAERRSNPWPRKAVLRTATLCAAPPCTAVNPSPGVATPGMATRRTTFQATQCAAGPCTARHRSAQHRSRSTQCSLLPNVRRRAALHCAAQHRSRPFSAWLRYLSRWRSALRGAARQCAEPARCEAGRCIVPLCRATRRTAQIPPVLRVATLRGAWLRYATQSAEPISARGLRPSVAVHGHAQRSTEPACSHGGAARCLAMPGNAYHRTQAAPRVQTGHIA